MMDKVSTQQVPEPDKLPGIFFDIRPISNLKYRVIPNISGKP